MQGTFQVSLSSLGVLLAFATVGGLVSGFLAGRLIRRLGLGLFLLSGSSLGIIGIVGYILSPSWPVVLVSVTFATMGSGMLDVGMNIFVSSNYSAGRLNWLHAAFGAGTTLGPIIATFGIVSLGQSWRWSYVVVALLELILWICLLLTSRHWSVRTIREVQSSGAQVAGIIETFRVPIALFLLALFFFYGGTEIGTGQLANTLFIQGRGIDQSTSSFWISIYWACFTLGRVLMGTIVDRLSSHDVLRVSMIGAVIGAALLWQNLVQALAFAGVALLGFSLAPMFPMLIAATSRFVQPRYTPTLIGFEISATGLGGAVLPGLAGMLGDRLGVGVLSPFPFVVALGVLVIYEIVNLRHSQSVPVPAMPGD